MLLTLSKSLIPLFRPKKQETATKLRAKILLYKHPKQIIYRLPSAFIILYDPNYTTVQLKNRYGRLVFSISIAKPTKSKQKELHTHGTSLATTQGASYHITPCHPLSYPLRINTLIDYRSYLTNSHE